MKVGFTCSTFDLLHAGHIVMLEDARKQCDYLIVGLQTDPTIDRPDTKNKPIQSIVERYIQLKAVKYIDEIRNLLDYVNQCLKNISSVYSSRRYFVNDHLELTTT